MLVFNVNWSFRLHKMYFFVLREVIFIIIHKFISEKLILINSEL